MFTNHIANLIPLQTLPPESPRRLVHSAAWTNAIEALSGAAAQARGWLPCGWVGVAPNPGIRVA